MIAVLLLVGTRKDIDYREVCQEHPQNFIKKRCNEREVGIKSVESRYKYECMTNTKGRSDNTLTMPKVDF